MKTRYWQRLLAAATAMLAIALFAACGDDDDDDAGNGGGGNDEEYVADLCKATLNFQNAFADLDLEDIDDEDEAFEAFEGPFEDFVNEMEDANPPDDLEDFHNDALDQFREILDAIRDQDSSAVEQITDTELPDPPADVQARFDALAQDNEDCVEAGVTFDD